MTPLTPQALSRVLAEAEQRLSAGHAAETRNAMNALLRVHPQEPRVHRLHGLANQLLGEFAAAEGSLMAAAGLLRRDPRSQSDLGNLFAASNRPGQAEKAFRAALALNRMYEPAAAGLARLLVRLDRAEEALRITNPLVAGASVGEPALSAHAQALRALKRDEEARVFLERAAAANPASSHARYRLAGVYSDLGRHADAEGALLAAMERGYDNAEVRLALAHVLQDQDRFDEAEAAYRQAIAMQPDHLGAHADLAELVWMRTADAAAATTDLERVMTERPQDWSLMFAKWRTLSHTGDLEGAMAAIESAVALYPKGGVLQNTASRAASALGRTREALDYAEKAFAIDPTDRQTRGILVQALLGEGENQRAGQIAEAMVAEDPDHQFALALQAVCWRLLGDPRYAELYDYKGLVRVTELATPKGWTRLGDYLADLKAALERMHGYKAHPFGQSVRGGSQVGLRHVTDPVVRAIHQAIGPPIDEWTAAMGPGADPVRRRNSGRWTLEGIWSVRLTSAGYHDDHVHPGGWLSSACYIDLPDLADDTTKAGWLKFGEPGRLITRPALEPEHFVRPEPGRLVLFPSYMWHGTVPFESDRARLSVAFDAVPA